jgi:peptidoglycan/xylan/chitin deacetylase (PgdA/CDA1 family)
VLKDYVEFVHLDDWVSQATSETRPRKTQCAITLDDGWRDNYEYAYPIFEELEIPATIFLATSFIGSNKKFWPERLSDLLGRPAELSAASSESLQSLAMLLDVGADALVSGSLDTDETIERFKRHGDDRILGVLGELEASIGERPNDSEKNEDFLTWEQVCGMHQSGLIRFGSHTVNHLRLLGGHDSTRIVEELSRSKSEIAVHTGTEPALFCYPNGEYSESIVELVRERYRGACTTDPGWVGRDDDPCRLKRICLSEGGSSEAHTFLARLS